MIIIEEMFTEYWTKRGQYDGYSNNKRLYNNWLKQLKEINDSVDLDDYIMSLKSGKETWRKIAVEFYGYLEEKGYGKVESDLYDKHFYDYPFERQLEMAKFLHLKHTEEEILDRFDIDSRTMRADLQALSEGITVLGSTIRIEKTKEKSEKKVKNGKKAKIYYHTTLHPIFLPLNLTEVYALTVYLDKVIKDNDPNAYIIRDISHRVKSQLSEYAISKLFRDDVEDGYVNQYINDEELARQREGIYMYLMKSGQKCKFMWQGKEYYGGIDLVEEEYKVRTDDGQYLDAELKDIDFIIESLDYR